MKEIEARFKSNLDIYKNALQQQMKDRISDILSAEKNMLRCLHYPYKEELAVQIARTVHV